MHLRDVEVNIVAAAMRLAAHAMPIVAAAMSMHSPDLRFALMPLIPVCSRAPMVAAMPRMVSEFGTPCPVLTTFAAICSLGTAANAFVQH